MSCPSLQDERGMVMGLTIMLVVVIGVLGAGLLVFVQRDLESATRYSGGARALGLAETGVQVARRELLEVPHPQSYDGGSPVDVPHPESRWSFASSPVGCGDLGEGTGRCVEAEEGVIRVSIRYLPPPVAPSGVGSRNDPNYVPEPLPAGAGEYPDGREYFGVESDGVAGDYRRRVQAILVLAPTKATGGEVAGPAGSYVRVWSWRECRESACL